MGDKVGIVVDADMGKNNKERLLQRMNAYMEKLQKAYRTGRGDPMTLIELVEAAKGKRSQRKFADDLGVNVSSVSRILSGKVSEISDELLAKIAACADPDSGVTIEKLMEAQGIVEAENRAQLAMKFEEACRRIIADELLSRGKSVAYPNDGRVSRMSRYMCDFEIKTDALKRGDGRWMFEVKMMNTSAKLPAGVGRTMIWVDSAMAAYYRGESIGRISLVVDHRIIYEDLKHRLEEQPINDEISIILISVGQGKILDEYVAPLIDGRTPDFTFKN